MRTRFDSAVGPAVQRLWSILLAAFSILLAPGPAPAQEGALRGFDAYVEAAMKEWKVPGLAVAVVKDDRLIHARGYGVKEVGRPDLVDEHTLFAVGSTSKAFTTAALGMLVDEGKLDWDDRVVEGLSGFRLYDPYVTREMRIRDLVTHRSGLSRADRLWYVGYPREEVLRRIRFHEPTWSFRTHYGYQNIMFLAAGQIIPEVTGTSWDDFVDRRIFTPLGMERSNTSVTALEGDANVATPHMLVEGEPVPIRYRNIDNVGPAGSINSSTAEMARWVRLHLGGGVFEGRRLLKEETVAEIHSPQTVMPIDEDIRELYPTTHFRAYGFGWYLQDHRGAEGGAARGWDRRDAGLRGDDPGGGNRDRASLEPGRPEHGDRARVPGPGPAPRGAGAGLGPPPSWPRPRKPGPGGRSESGSSGRPGWPARALPSPWTPIPAPTPTASTGRRRRRGKAAASSSASARNTSGTWSTGTSTSSGPCGGTGGWTRS